ncbi:MAG: FAD-linked oxidase C-terminal domain-containing protein [Pseudomonadota bacterium]
MKNLLKTDQKMLARRYEIASDLRELVLDATQIIDDKHCLRPYESDGLTAYQTLPMLVCLPSNVDELSSILRYCHQNEIKVVARGAGTSLSGGAHPIEDGVIISLGKFNQILDIDYDNQAVVVQSGVTNLAITKAVQDRGFYYAPDPSSQIACTIGGNVAENAGGIHCLKYGLTTHNLLGLEVVLMNGEIIRLGGKHLDSSGYDLMGVLTGSEGLLGVVSEVTVKILKKPVNTRAMLIGFDDEVTAGACVSQIIRSGIIPAAMEMMDNAAIRAISEYIDAGYPIDAAALIIVEVDGLQSEVDEQIAQIDNIAVKHQAMFKKCSQNDEERQKFWDGRKAAFSACGRLTPDYLVMDGTIPRKKLPEILKKIRTLSAHYDLRVVNVFHAGDGNLHPLILFDSQKQGELKKAEQFGGDILRLCVEVGGVLTGEHGVGIEKRDLMHEMFSAVDLSQQQKVKCAFDPQQLLNPGKVFPTLHRCAEMGQLHVHRGRLPFPDLPRF